MSLKDRNKISIRGKKISVIGLGKSGYAATLLAHHLGGKVFASDLGSTQEILDRTNLLHQKGVQCETGQHSDRIYDADLFIVSPGISKDANILSKAQDHKIPIVGEIEFASWFTEAPIIAVTGSNGKTTTVHILVAMCQSDSVNGELAGNMGIPFSEKVIDEIKHPDPNRVYILEISSFQMEFIYHFKPKIGIFLNISPDHLDRHRTMAEYVAMKLNMVQNQISTDAVVFNSDDPQLATSLNDYPSQKLPFSLLQSNVTFPLNATKVYDTDGEPFVYMYEVALPGKHNLANMLAAATAANHIGIDKKNIADVMKSFAGVEHRLEHVKKLNDILYINDSKATNLESVIVALESFDKPVVLILGGRNKGADFRLLLPHTKRHVKLIISYGEAGGEIAAALGDAVRLERVTSLMDAVATAHTLASPGDIVLLSPGCASFDQFSNFEERGQQFKSWVDELEVN